MKVPFYIILLFIAVIQTCLCKSDTLSKDVVISSVNQAVDLTSHLPKITSKVTYRNGGKSPLDYVHFVVTPNLAEFLAFAGATVGSDDELVRLTVDEVQLDGHKDKAVYRLVLADPLDAGQETTVDVETVFSHSLQPYPQEILQSEKQYVRLYANAYFYAPYTSETQTTVFSLPSEKVESYTKTPKPVNQDAATITYGEYTDVAPFKQSEVVLHYENNHPFLTVSELDRLIEVSHWGNIAVEESIDIRHTGAKLKGAFSRFDYHRSQDGISSVKSFKTLLPPSARDVYYRDEIGNISTSALHETEEFVEVELHPRFPLFGGWKTHYLLGYNVPSYQFLYSSGDKFVLKMRFVDHVFDDQVIERATVRIILPEGCQVLHLETPYTVQRQADTQHFTYLDSRGRPVVTAVKENLVDNHIQDFEVHYTFRRVEMVLEPLMVVSAFYLLFLAVIVYVRLDFSITKDEVTESRLRVAGLMEQVQGVHDRRSALYQAYEDAINKFKSNKDNASFTANRKKIDADYKTLSDQLKTLQNKLKAENPEVAEKVFEVQRLDQQIKDQIGVSVQQAEKLVSGKISKQAYVDTEASNSSRKDELCHKIDTLLATA